MTLQAPVEERVTDLEALMAQLTLNVNSLSNEMREFKDEMSDFKDEMREFKDEMREFKDEMREFKDEMSDFKDEMHDYKDETQRVITRMNKQWGELSNKMGTMVEDLVAPSIGRILRTVINCPEDKIDMVAIRVKQRRVSDGQMREFDAIAVCGEYLFVNETKSRLRSEDVTAFARSLPEARTYFSEYQNHKVIGAVASLYVDESVVQQGQRLGLIVLGFGEDVMDVLNTEDFQPKEF